VVTASPASAAQALPASEWEAKAGDELIVDVANNMGYVLRADEATYLPFLLASGQKRTVRYLGMTYFAATPTGSWVVKSMKIQGDRVTFGKSGRFLRLYKEGKTYTHYGIHSFKNIDDWLESEDRYRSLGCVVVQDEMMNILEKIYELNGESLKVTTTAGPQFFLHTLALREERERQRNLTARQGWVIE
jgi:hypothetical protein